MLSKRLSPSPTAGAFSFIGRGYDLITEMAVEEQIFKGSFGSRDLSNFQNSKVYADSVNPHHIKGRERMEALERFARMTGGK
jgi:hypothetical protein